MKRKTSSAPTRIWSYSCRPPVSSVPELEEQLLLAHTYQNTLVEVEQRRRRQYAEVRAVAEPEVPRLEAERDLLSTEIDRFRAELSATRKAARKRARNPELEARVRELTLLRKTAQAALVASRDAYRQTMADLNQRLSEGVACAMKSMGGSGPRIVERARREVTLEMLADGELSEVWRWHVAVDGAASAAKKAARAASGLPPGTYLLVEKSLEGAKDPAFVSVRTRRRRDQPMGTPGYVAGRVGVMVRPGLTVRDLFDGSWSQLRMTPLPETQWDTRPGRMHAYSMATLRIGAGDDKGVGTTFSVMLHRKPPMDATVRSVWLLVRHEGRRTRFELQLTLESATFSPERSSSGRTAAIDFGWRVREKGLRVAYLVDDAGHEEELLLPARIPDAFRQASAIGGANDRHFEVARAVLGEWLAAHAPPDWLREATETLGLWKSHSRLSEIAQRLEREVFGDAFFDIWSAWKTERLAARADFLAPVDEVLLWAGRRGVTTPLALLTVYLGLWRQKDAHLDRYASGVRRRAINRRTDLYRCFAKRLRAAYERVLFEDIELATFTRNATPESAAGAVPTLHRTERDAAVGELRQTLEEALGAAAVPMPAAMSTRRCHRCLHRNPPAPKDSLVLTCESCGAEWDQDSNACRNFLIDAGPLGSAAPPRTRGRRAAAAPSAAAAAE